MNLKFLGSMLIIIGCGMFGILISGFYRREIRILSELIRILDFMQCELQYRLTPLPELCRQAAAESSNALRSFFLLLTYELENQIRPNVSSCVKAALQKAKGLPEKVDTILSRFGNGCGRFDVEGQIMALEEIRASSRQTLDKLRAEKEPRLRSYQTLGLCAGAAIAILFI